MEYLCSNEGIGPTAERLEVVLCHILIPLFLQAATIKNGYLLFITYYSLPFIYSSISNFDFNIWQNSICIQYILLLILLFTYI